MNIYKHELKQNIKSLYIWSAVLVVTVVFFMLFYPSFSADIDAFEKMMDNYPEALKAAFGLTILDISTAIGFYSFVFIYVILFAAIQAANLGVSVFSKEVRDKTADFLLTKPVSRSKVITGKTLACLSILIGTNVIYNIITTGYMMLVYSEETPLKTLILVNLSLVFMQLIFFALGMIIAVILKRVRTVLPISLGLVFLFYILNTILLVGKDNGMLRYFTPFQYFIPAEIQKTDAYESKFIVAAIIVILICVTSSYVIYRKKDIR